jgi:predicted nucleic acid-binding protein
MAKARRVAWDACSWIATIIQEVVTLKDGSVEDRGRLCRHTIEQAQRGLVEIATSGLSLAEVCKHDEVHGEDPDVLTDFFRNDYLLIVPVDRAIGSLAREIMQTTLRKHQVKIKPPDAVHLATAIFADATEFHTFDGKLLNLDQQLPKPNGGVLTIRKPPEPPLELFPS